MTLSAFQKSLAETEPPTEALPELKSLWLALRGRWEESHNIAQDIPSADGSWLHALLHLIEGDIGNAHYWYARARRPAKARTDIQSEGEALAKHLCEVG
jgi:hypothetical protein